jgi:hypothetical protein
MKCFSRSYISYRNAPIMGLFAHYAYQGGSAMSDMRITPRLHLHSDIPVVEVEGEWDEATGQTVSDIVTRLIRTGHFEIIVNLTRMTLSIPMEASWQEVLERIAANIRTHCGRLDVVGTVDQIRRYVRKQARSRLFWATSEEEAVGRIKGLTVCRRGPILSLRLAQ